MGELIRFPLERRRRAKRAVLAVPAGKEHTKEYVSGWSPIPGVVVTGCATETEILAAFNGGVPQDSHLTPTG